MPGEEEQKEERARAPRRVFRLSVGAVVVLVIGALSVTVGIGLLRGQTAVSESIEISSGSEVLGAQSEIYVHVLGAVTSPGLYMLDADARVVDALAAAGGSTEDADLRAVNLARPISDGEQLFVPTEEETASFEGFAGASDGRIDINTADSAELETLPRIGPALAQRIIDWRESNGRFRSVEDLLAVPGIGEKLLAGIRDAVRV